MSDQPVLDQVNVVVNDMEAMAAFYQRLGVRLQGGQAAWAAHHRSAEETAPARHGQATRTAAGLDLDLDSKVFAGVWNAGWPAGRTGVVLGFKLASREAVDRLYDSLTADGYAGQQPPYDAFWGARYAVVEDPDGNSVGLMSPSDPALAAAPPDPPA